VLIEFLIIKDVFTSMVNSALNLFRFFNSNEVMQNPKFRSIILKLVLNAKSKRVYILIHYLDPGSNPA